MTARGRVLRQGDATVERADIPTPVFRATHPARRIPGEIVEASERAQRIEAAARSHADEVIDAAERQAAGARLRIETEARAAGAAAVAAHAVALAAREAVSLTRQRDMVVSLARVLAERMLGEQLRLEPNTVVALATQVVAEARGAQRLRLVAHPADVPLLEGALERIAGGRAIEIVAGERRRGELRVESEIGVLDGELAPQLDRLASRLREVLEE